MIPYCLSLLKNSITQQDCPSGLRIQQTPAEPEIRSFIQLSYVSAPVHPHFLIIVKTHENRIEHILATLQMT
jgi:hypothetical protein